MSKFNIPFEAYKPTVPENFWCHFCDREIVDSNDPNTGSFFVASGHSWSQRDQSYNGDYHMVMFARCKKCCTEIT